VRIRQAALWFAFAFVAIGPAAAQAQELGVMESAETINRGNFKIRLNPMLVFGKDGEDHELGLAALLGYGLTRNFDLEGGVAFYDGTTFFGATAEVWLIRERPFDLSVVGGIHGRTGDRTADLTGVDLTFLGSGHATDRLEFYTALDLAFEGIGNDADFRTVHLVPGIEYRISDDLDFVAEVGLALNDRARHYVSGGLAFYVR
jgi:hypothetical protein